MNPASGQRRAVLFLTSWYPSGARPTDNVFVREHARAAAAVHDVTVLHVPDPNTDSPPPHGLTAVSDPEVTAGLPTFRYATPRPPLERLAFPRFLAACWRGVRRLRQDGREFDLIHAQTLDAGVAGVLLGRRLDVPVVLTEHFSGFALGRLTRYQRLKARFVYPRVERVLPVSIALRDALRAQGLKADYEVVPNAVDTSVFRPGEEVPDGLHLLYVGRLHPVKRVDRLLEALAELKVREVGPAHLNIVGDGPDAAALQRLASHLGVTSDVTFHGRLGREAVADRLRRSSVLVLASATETFGAAALEALASGVPVVAPYVGALGELVTEGRGRLVTPEPARLADAVLEVTTEHAPVSRRQVAAEVAQSYSIEAVGRRLQDVYRTVLRA